MNTSFLTSFFSLTQFMHSPPSSATLSVALGKEKGLEKRKCSTETLPTMLRHTTPRFAYFRNLTHAPLSPVFLRKFVHLTLQPEKRLREGIDLFVAGMRTINSLTPQKLWFTSVYVLFPFLLRSHPVVSVPSLPSKLFIVEKTLGEKKYETKGKRKSTTSQH